ncbi:MAG: glycosyltransferase family 1 protein [Anaerolineaceae bacterium]|nr:MAG: glycosyltransferase family 1 protein [Anaerolineaceae bacterium]
MVKPVATVNVVPKIPRKLKRLEELASNLRWAWDFETIMLFRRLDTDLWIETGRNPSWMLGLVSQERFNEAQNDPSFMAHYQRALDSFDAYMSSKDTWYDKTYNGKERPIIAYFSTEFGITECLANYSGGLGILSGDHLKSASDLGLPLVAVGLLYQEGYFQQYLNADGYQQESYPINDYGNLPVTLQRDKDGQPIKISVPMPGREILVQIWKVQVGRVALYLLDSNLPENELEEDRNLTDRLYGGDRRTRIRQEIIMGIGGIRALDALGLRPTICHMNEGHSAFLALERIRQLMDEHGLTFDQAREVSRAHNLFTTHTPVPAGLERFGFDLIDEHFTDYFAQIGLTREQFINLGREDMGDYELFSMPVLAVNLSSNSNGVAQLHGQVSRQMWHWVYPELPENEIPIQAITNGIHMMSWVSGDMQSLFDRYLNPAWRTDESNPEIWKDVEEIPPAELWRTHERRRERLVAFTRERLRDQFVRRGLSQMEIEGADEVLNPDTLTIGFARRFATYKRATLLMRDLDRLDRLLNDPERPVQIIFAGKAHPHDEGGKALIKEIVHVSRLPQFRNRIVFLENYDMLIGRYMVQGVDIWLNNPRRPKEASGTSGMKVIYNGGLNCSILDGWWAEAYSPDVGWAIGNGEEYEEDNWAHQDAIEAEALYNVLEQDIVPTFYGRSRDGLPREWINKVKASMQKLAPFFNTRRMVQQYAEDYYLPMHERVKRMGEPNGQTALDYAAWRISLDALWRNVAVESVDVGAAKVSTGGDVPVEASVRLGDLTPDDVTVQLYYGQLDTRGHIRGDVGQSVDMAVASDDSGGVYTFKAKVTLSETGDKGLSVRVIPKHDLLPTPFQPNLITWA